MFKRDGSTGEKPGFLRIEKCVSKKDQRNEYLLFAGQDAAVIDICDTLEETEDLLEKEGKTLKYILVTHAHPSHLRCIKPLKEKYGGAFCLHSHEDDLLEAYDAALQPDIFLKDDAKLRLGDISIKVLHTPGHTKGSVCFYVKEAKALFSGNTLLEGGHGKIWGPKSMSHVIYSLKRLNYALPMETVVYPIRGNKTTLKKESWMNCLRSA